MLALVRDLLLWSAGFRDSYYEKDGVTVFRIQEASVSEGIYFAIDSRKRDKADEEKEASFRSALSSNNRDGLGFESVKEIWLGYSNQATLKAWEKILGLAGKLSDTLWQLDKTQRIRFVPGEHQGVVAIVCKVDSIKKAEEYLKGRTQNCWPVSRP